MTKNISSGLQGQEKKLKSLKPKEIQADLQSHRVEF
jgi:hypothetical protein